MTPTTNKRLPRFKQFYAFGLAPAYLAVGYCAYLLVDADIAEPWTRLTGGDVDDILINGAIAPVLAFFLGRLAYKFTKLKITYGVKSQVMARLCEFFDVTYNARSTGRMTPEMFQSN